MYSDGLVRQLCSEIAATKDPEKTHDLTSLLQAVIKDDQEEIEVRIALLASKYANATGKFKAAD